MRGDGAFTDEIGVQRSAAGSYWAPSPRVRDESCAVVAWRPPHTSRREPVHATAVGWRRGDGAPIADISFQDLRDRSSTAPSPSVPGRFEAHPPQTINLPPASATA